MRAVVGRIGLCVAAVLMATVASAAPLTLTSIFGGFQNPNPAENPNLGPDGRADLDINNVGGAGTDTIRWGTGSPRTPPDATQSGYDFNPTDPSITPTNGVPFVLGVFTHQNLWVEDPLLLTVEYSLSINTNGVPGTFSTTFTFSHNETSNATPCPIGSIGICDDFVGVSGDTLFQAIDVGGEIWTFSLLGFSSDGGVTFPNQFQTREPNSPTSDPQFTNVSLYAVATLPTDRDVPEVPEPSTFLLLGGGILAVIGRQIVRRRAR